MIEKAIVEALSAEIFIVIGTSLVVYPAAGLLEFVPDISPKYLIDPAVPEYHIYRENLVFIQEKAGKGTRELVDKLLNS